MKLRILLTLAVFTAALTASAAVRLASPFQEHMVLQREKPVAVWGWADSGEKVTVTLGGNSASATAGDDGKWSLFLPAMKHGGPFKMDVSASNTITFNDIYIGEVWLCSGQSNMVMTVAKEDRYWCGVYNEEKEVAAANFPLIRVYTVDFDLSDTPLDSCSGKWEVVSPQTIGHMSAAGYFFARDIFQRYKIPVGLIVTAYGASTVESWTSRDAMAGNDRIKYLVDKYDAFVKDYDSGAALGRYQVELMKWQYSIDNPGKTPSDAEVAKMIASAMSGRSAVTAQGTQADAPRSQDVNAPAAARKDVAKKPAAPKNLHRDQHAPFLLWNAMVNPLVPYTIRGALWYQGESNGGTAAVYREQMEVMIKDWRKRWNLGDFPFYYVQLANRDNPEDIPAKGGQDALVREAQLQNLWMRNTGMVVAIDNANPEDPVDVHPKNKQEIGRRLALIARAKVYGEKNLVYSGPVYSGAEIIGDRVIISFDHTGGGLRAKDGKLQGFAIAGADGKFVWGDARIEGNSVVVSSPAIKEPAMVNYGFGRNPLTSLYNKEGLPASPFRTNDK